MTDNFQKEVLINGNEQMKFQPNFGIGIDVWSFVLDYSLTELYQEDNIPKKSYQITLPEYIAESFNFDKEYTSQLLPSNINFPEDDKNFKKRVKNFIKEVIKNNYKSNDNILLVTHQGVFDTILDILRKKSSIDTEIKSDKGKFVKIFEDTKWNIKKIN